jgi:soluble lytic murein transglycosylase-like protein
MKKILIGLVLSLLVISATFTNKTFADDSKKECIRDTVDSMYNTLPPCLRIFDYIQKYAAEYDIPLNIAFGLVHYESGYRGIYHTDYNPKLTSPHKAYGACQIKVGTANLISDKKITKNDLLNNTELNVAIAFKLLSMLKDQYGSWKLALGAYNTGKPVVNKYAQNIIKYKLNNIYTCPNKG